jgi:hypothetical protein
MRAIASLIACIGLAGIVTACTPDSAPPNESGVFASVAVQSVAPVEPYIDNSIEQAGGNAVLYTVTPCFGTCPAYSLNLFDDGVLLFRPEYFRSGEGDVLLNKDAFAAPDGFVSIIEDMKGRGLLDLNDDYSRTLTDVSCATDFSTKILEVRTSAFTKRIEFYTGCSGFADERKVREFFDFVEDRIGATDLVSKTGETDSKQ